MTTKVKRDEQVTDVAPSSWFSLRNIGLALIFAGILVSGYLTYVKFTATPMICVQGSVFNCTTVQNSAWSTLLGVPIAYLGLAMYLTMGALFLLEDANDFLRENAILLQFIIGLFAWLYSIWLVYVQIVLLQALCQWCLTHEAIMTVLFGVISIRLWNSLRVTETA